MDDAPTDFSHNVWDLIHSSPRLSSVKLLSEIYPFGTAPWQQLKCINFMFMVPITDFLSSLYYCQNLDVLNLRLGIDIYVSDFSSFSLPEEPILLPALRELTLGDIRDGLPALATIIKAPALTKLSLFSVYPEDVSAFKFFMSNSRCAIKSFRLHSNYISPTELLDWLDTPELSSIIDVGIDIEATRIKIHRYQLCAESTQTTLELAVDKIKEFTWVHKGLNHRIV